MIKLTIVLLGLLLWAGGANAQSSSGGCTWNPCAPSTNVYPNSILTTDPNGAIQFSQQLPGGSIPNLVECVSTANAGGTPDAINISQLPCAATTSLLILNSIGPNLTTTPTIKVTGNPIAQVIQRPDGSPLVLGDLPPAGGKALLTNNGTNWFLLSILPGTGGNPGSPFGSLQYNNNGRLGGYAIGSSFSTTGGTFDLSLSSSLGTLQYNNGGHLGGYTIGPSFTTNGGVFDIGPGFVANNIGTLGGSLSGTLPNPLLAPSAACTNLGAWLGDLSGAACSAPVLAMGAAARNVGALGGALAGTLPSPTLAPLAVATALGPPAGDVKGTSYKTTLVTGLQGTPICSVQPTAQTGLVFNGTCYTPAPFTPGITQLQGAVTAGPGFGVQTATISASTITNQNLVSAPGLTLKGNPTVATGSESDIPVSGGLGFSGGALAINPSGVTAQQITFSDPVNTTDCMQITTTGQVANVTLGQTCSLATVTLTADDGLTGITADDGLTLISPDGASVPPSGCTTNLVGDFSDATGCNLTFVMVAFH